MKTLMIIGAGFGQVPAIKRASELGIRTICIDRNPKAVGMSMVDYSYAVDVVDFDGALEIAKKHQIDGVMTMQSDLPVPTIGFINDTLKLKGVSLETAGNCSNKVSTRKKLAECNCLQPDFRIAETVESAMSAATEIGFPCVIKAPDSSGSRGVIKVNHQSDVEPAFEEALRFTRGTEILVEEFIEGLEFGAQTFSVNGICSTVLLHNDILSPPPYMIPVGHSFPFKYLNDLERELAISDIQKAVLALGIFDGPSNVDLILDKKDNRVKIIEIGARIGATCLPELVFYHTGIDWVQATINSAINESPDLNVIDDQPVAAFIIESPKDGKFNSFEISNQKPTELLEFEITVEKGEEVSKLRKGTDRIGKIICTGNSADQAELNSLSVMEQIKIVVDE